MSHKPSPPTIQIRSANPDFDPQIQPVVPTKFLLPLLPETLSLRFIQQAFNQSVVWQVEPIFTTFFKEGDLVHTKLRRAAVFIPLVPRPSGLHVIFTRRAPHLYDHAGQISFPGGRIEPTDRDEIAAALRETQEEIGVGPEFIQLIGTQPGYITTTRFAMTPVIGFLKPGFTITPDKTEVAEVFEVPLAVLMDPRRHRLHHVPAGKGPERYYFSISWRSYFIWGATAALIRNVYHYLAAAQHDDSRLDCLQR